MQAADFLLDHDALQELMSLVGQRLLGPAFTGGIEDEPGQMPKVSLISWFLSKSAKMHKAEAAVDQEQVQEVCTRQEILPS